MQSIKFDVIYSVLKIPYFMRVLDFAILRFCIKLKENKIEKVKHILTFYLIYNSQQNNSKILKSLRGASRNFTHILFLCIQLGINSILYDL